MTENILLRVSDLYCERDDRELLDGLVFSAGAGELWQVSGPNGAGKTTLLKILAGLYGHFEGSVQWRAADDGCHQFLYIGHQAGLRDELTALENLYWLYGLQGQATDGVANALGRVGLVGFEDVPVGQLSAGQKRRVMLSRLWHQPPGVWILDEPFTAIDAEGVALLEHRLREHANSGGLVIYTSHHRLAADIRVIWIDRGKGRVRP